VNAAVGDDAGAGAAAATLPVLAAAALVVPTTPDVPAAPDGLAATDVPLLAVGTAAAALVVPTTPDVPAAPDVPLLVVPVPLVLAPGPEVASVPAPVAALVAGTVPVCGIMPGGWTGDCWPDAGTATTGIGCPTLQMSVPEPTASGCTVSWPADCCGVP
jgi:hypothetical protein